MRAAILLLSGNMQVILVLDRVVRVGIGAMDRSTKKRISAVAVKERISAVALVLALGLGCSANRAPEPKLGGATAPAAPQGAPLVTTDRLIVTSEETIDLRELLERGRRHLNEGRPSQALRDFERVVQHDSEGDWAQAALFETARAHEELGDHRRASDSFERLARRYPEGDYAREGLLRAIRLAIYLEEWQRGGELARLYQERHTKLSAREALVTHAARALASLHELEAGGPEAGFEQAEIQLAHGRRIIERHRLDGAGVIPRDLAQLYYALGELRRLKGERIRFDPLPPDFAEVFERRAQLLLDAQQAYSDAMRAHDAHWTAMAGFRVGELYYRLHSDVMAAPRPAGADTERRRRLFEAAVRLKYSILLRKGLNMMDHTLRMAERTGERSSWVERTRAARSELERALKQGQDALDAAEFSREELERVLRRIPAS